MVMAFFFSQIYKNMLYYVSEKCIAIVRTYAYNKDK